jgi:hypothetical protein
MEPTALSRRADVGQDDLRRGQRQRRAHTSDEPSDEKERVGWRDRAEEVAQHG